MLLLYYTSLRQWKPMFFPRSCSRSGILLRLVIIGDSAFPIFLDIVDNFCWLSTMMQKSGLIKKLFTPTMCSQVKATLWCKTEHAILASFYITLNHASAFICSILPFYFPQHGAMETFLQFDAFKKQCQINTFNFLLFFETV